MTAPRQYALQRLLRLLTAIACLASFTPQTFAGSASPEITVQRFYAWYLGAQSHQRFPLMDDAIRQYVARPTLDALRAAYREDRLPDDVDYFTKVQDYDEADWGAHIVAHPAVRVGARAIVAVTLGSRDMVTVLVILTQHDDAWRIVKIIDAETIP